MPPLIVGVVPARERESRSALFGALQASHPVRFEGREQGCWSGLDAVLAIGPEACAALPAGLPCLAAVGEEQTRGGAATLRLGDTTALARPLRGAQLREAHCGGLAPEHAVGGDILAWISEAPAWTTRHTGSAIHRVVSALPAELGPSEVLRARLVSGRCLALLALVQFLRDVTAERCWLHPPPSAAFILDDPNLHWPTYGHVRYDELARNAAEHGYHVAVAMSPIDGWFTHPGVARLFRESRNQLSVCVHGNDHDGPELGRPRSLSEGVRLASQALRRTAAFERRAGVRVDRVMVPPHESLSEATARALLTCGFEAVCSTRPYPWIRSSPDIPWLSRPPHAGRLVGWHGAELVADGLPVLMRADFWYPREEFVFRAFLGQPILLVGHHDLLREGPGVLATAASEIGRLGSVRWASLGRIARGTFQTRRTGQALELRLRTRRIQVDVPAGVDELRVDVRALMPAPAARLRVGGRALLARPGHGSAEAAGNFVPIAEDGLASVPVRAGGQCELRLVDRPGAAAEPASSPHPRLRPLARRVMSECRDRGQAATQPRASPINAS